MQILHMWKFAASSPRVIDKTAEQRLPGGAANVAANLRALDADVFFLSIIGDDIAGTLLREELCK